MPMPNGQSDGKPGAEDYKDLISLDNAAKQSGLSASQLRLLIRKGEVWGIKIGRNWVTKLQAVRQYQALNKHPGRPRKT